MGFLQLSKAWSSSFSYLNILSTGAFLLLLRLILFCFVRLSNFFWQGVFKAVFFHFPSLFHQLKGNAKIEIERKNGPYILAFQQIRISIGDCERRKMFP